MAVAGANASACGPHTASAPRLSRRTGLSVHDHRPVIPPGVQEYRPAHRRPGAETLPRAAYGSAFREWPFAAADNKKGRLPGGGDGLGASAKEGVRPQALAAVVSPEPAGALVRGVRPEPRSSRMGLATKTEEYVPARMPMSMARAKSWMTAPPKK